MPQMTIREYAAHRGVALYSVQFALKRGRISQLPNGKIDSEQADDDWERNTNHAHVTRGLRAEQRRSQRSATSTSPNNPGSNSASDSPPTPAEGQGADAPTGSLDYAKARAYKEFYSARLAKIDYEERTGKLVDANQVKVTTFELFRGLRNQVVNLPDRLSSQLAAESDALEVHRILSDAIREVFGGFADSIS